jgi:hypothetical protein
MVMVLVVMWSRRPTTNSSRSEGMTKTMHPATQREMPLLLRMTSNNKQVLECRAWLSEQGEARGGTTPRASPRGRGRGRGRGKGKGKGKGRVLGGITGRLERRMDCLRPTEGMLVRT